MIKLWNHQQETYRVYQTRPWVFDMSDAGTGKTLAALAAFADRRRRGGKRALIIAPKTLLESAWAEEIDKFLPHLTYSIAYATNRLEAFSVKADIYITNTDAVKWVADMKPGFLDSFDTLIVDESSAFKHRQSERSKAMKKISKHFRFKALLSATPFTKSVTELWHQMLILDGGKLFGKSFASFRDAVCIPVPKDPNRPEYVTWVDRDGAFETIVQLMGDFCVRHEFHEVMPHIPHGTEHTVYFNLSPKARNTYEELRERTAILLEEGEVDAVNAAVLRTKLLQVASGMVYGTAGTALHVDDGRSELVCDLVQERRHSIVFYNWNHQRERLAKLLKARKIEFAEITSKDSGPKRRQIVAEYQAGRYQTLLMHPKTGAHGLTLTRGTATIWMSPTDFPDLLIQGKHRVLRGTQTEVTENVMVCARDTLEEAIYAARQKERNSIAELLELVRSHGKNKKENNP